MTYPWPNVDASYMYFDTSEQKDPHVPAHRQMMNRAFGMPTDDPSGTLSFRGLSLIKPIPVKQEVVYCQGPDRNYQQTEADMKEYNCHPVIYMRVKPGQIVHCKYCQIAYVLVGDDDKPVNPAPWRPKGYKNQQMLEMMHNPAKEYPKFMLLEDGPYNCTSFRGNTKPAVDPRVNPADYQPCNWLEPSKEAGYWDRFVERDRVGTPLRNGNGKNGNGNGMQWMD
eukprot:NODE_3596_length_907_cov_5.609557_g2993_i0.p1 GENE.NODE_3596_length_907_cov_5.609557_g2993_i0~~NODE_3596_length_907_cov_5.609557_g2993_i0.p1  ORF type:complete len:251 (-),score=49.69 NODE_3596_length_907_cov_5.609557_g2993_i0:154-825(-)